MSIESKTLRHSSRVQKTVTKSAEKKLGKATNGVTFVLIKA
jgi:hypothetical protein